MGTLARRLCTCHPPLLRSSLALPLLLRLPLPLLLLLSSLSSPRSTCAMPRSASVFCPPTTRVMTSTTVPRCAPPPLAALLCLFLLPLSQLLPCQRSSPTSLLQ